MIRRWRSLTIDGLPNRIWWWPEEILTESSDSSVNGLDSSGTIRFYVLDSTYVDGCVFMMLRVCVGMSKCHLEHFDYAGYCERYFASILASTSAVASNGYRS